MEKDFLKPLRKILKSAHGNQLAKYHQAGRLVLDLRPKKGHRWEKANKMAEIAAAVGCSVGLLYSLRDFATGYRRSDLSRLNGLNWSHMRHLCRLSPGKVRRQLESRCLLEFWSVARLCAEIRERFGARPRTNKAPTVPHTKPGDRLRVLNKMIDRWEATDFQWFGNPRECVIATNDERQVVAARLAKLQRILREEQHLLLAG